MFMFILFMFINAFYLLFIIITLNFYQKLIFYFIIHLYTYTSMLFKKHLKQKTHEDFVIIYNFIKQKELHKRHI